MMMMMMHDDGAAAAATWLLLLVSAALPASSFTCNPNHARSASYNLNMYALFGSNSRQFDAFGCSVAVSSGIAVVGAMHNSRSLLTYDKGECGLLLVGCTHVCWCCLIACNFPS